MAKTYKIVVLSDDETWSLAEGCDLMELTEEGYNVLLQGTNPHDIDTDLVVSLEELRRVLVDTDWEI